MRIVHVNGRYLREDRAAVSVFDRGFLFGDGVYEVVAVLDGRILDWDGHMRRLARSLEAIGVTGAPDAETLLAIHRALIRRNRLEEGRVYLEITRGVADRDFVFPRPAPAPTVVAFTQAASLRKNPDAETGIALAAVEDPRWKRRRVKSVALLAQVLAKEEARAKGAKEALMHEDGVVTEGGASTAFIVTADGAVVTREDGANVLPGVTRLAIERLCRETGLAFEGRPFTLDEVRAAREAFVAAASAFVLPCVSLDGAPIGDGRPGPIARRLRALYIDEARRAAV